MNKYLVGLVPEALLMTYLCVSKYRCNGSSAELDTPSKSLFFGYVRKHDPEVDKIKQKIYGLLSFIEKSDSFNGLEAHAVCDIQENCKYLIDKHHLKDFHEMDRIITEHNDYFQDKRIDIWEIENKCHDNDILNEKTGGFLNALNEVNLSISRLKSGSQLSNPQEVHV